MTDSAHTTPRPASLAYLVSQYPMLSMIFIIREVMQLRAMGFHIDVASINDADRSPKGLTADELSEAQRTHYVLAQGAVKALASHLLVFLSAPSAYARGLALAWRLGPWDLKRVFKNIVYFTEALMVGRWMKQIGQTHLHVHLGSQAATVGLFAREVFGVGYSITVHGPDEFYDAPGQYLTQKVMAADFIVCISHFARSQLMKLSPYEHWHKLHVSRLGVDPAVFAPRQAQRDPGQAFEVLCVGRLTPAKGQHLLVDAAKRLLDQGRRIHLRVVGAGTDAESLQAHVRVSGLQSHVTFEGAVNQDRIRDLYARADCFCIPSFAEGIPVVLMEAMAMGIPCVSTHITGIPELIRHGETGLLAAPSDVKGLAENIALLMDQPELVQRMATQARAKVMADYDLARNVDSLAGIFTANVGRTGR
jgi:colanic acid/amylovoran biosynthesis glycosyltransferase